MYSFWVIIQGISSKTETLTQFVKVYRVVYQNMNIYFQSSWLNKKKHFKTFIFTEQYSCLDLSQELPTKAWTLAMHTLAHIILK